MHERRRRETICVGRRINIFSLNVQLFRDFRLQYFVNLINLAKSTTALSIAVSGSSVPVALPREQLHPCASIMFTTLSR